MVRRTFKDLTGKKFNRLLVIEETDRRSNCGNIYWKCLCDCGKHTEAQGSYLLGGHTKSCGCLANEKRAEALALPEGEASFNKLFAQYKRQAGNRGLVFELNKEQFREITKKDCYYCGLSSDDSNISKTSSIGQYNYNGIDRVDSDLGYTLANVVTCCKKCNIAKSDMKQEEFYKWVISVYNHLNDNRL